MSVSLKFCWFIKYYLHFLSSRGNPTLSNQHSTTQLSLEICTCTLTQVLLLDFTF